MNDVVRTPQTPQALRRSLNAKLQAEAHKRGASVEHVRKQYVFALLFKRLFHERDAPWALLGGNALLLRIGNGRFTEDVDLARNQTWSTPEDLLTELTARTAPDMGDGFIFEFKRADTRNQPDQYGYGITSAKVSANALLGGSVFESFTLDIAVRRHVQEPLEHLDTHPIIDHPSLEHLPRVPVVPVESHLADKVCALYESHHGGKPSTRYRDLADIVRIVTNLPIDAARLTRTLKSEEGRRRITLPTQIKVPHQRWHHEYPAAASQFSEFPAEYRSLDASLSEAAQCLTPILNRERASGLWDPQTHTWNNS